MVSATKFRLNAKKIFFTYSQCNLELQLILDHYLEIGPIDYAVISSELHQDGNQHRHGYIEFVNKIDIKDVRRLYIENYKPNIQGTRNPKACELYVKKYGNVLEYGTSHNNSIIEKLYDEARSLSEEDFYDKCRQQRIPFQYAHHAWTKSRLQECLNTITETSTILGTITCERLQSLSLESLGGRSVWIKGPSGVGKTTWAKIQSRKPCLFVRHLDTLRQLLPTHRSIIFDDLSFLHIPREGQIQLVDSDDTQQIHVRYAVAIIPAGIQKIFLSNVEIFELDEAILRRITKIDLF